MDPSNDSTWHPGFVKHGTWKSPIWKGKVIWTKASFLASSRSFSRGGKFPMIRLRIYALGDISGGYFNPAVSWFRVEVVEVVFGGWRCGGGKKKVEIPLNPTHPHLKKRGWRFDVDFVWLKVWRVRIFELSSEKDPVYHFHDYELKRGKWPLDHPNGGHQQPLKRSRIKPPKGSLGRIFWGVLPFFGSQGDNVRVDFHHFFVFSFWGHLGSDAGWSWKIDQSECC